ncbi:hypothetical protein M9458_022854, partial [Cirrhinus mrigala]
TRYPDTRTLSRSISRSRTVPVQIRSRSRSDPRSRTRIPISRTLIHRSRTYRSNVLKFDYPFPLPVPDSRIPDHDTRFRITFPYPVYPVSRTVIRSRSSIPSSRFQSSYPYQVPVYRTSSVPRSVYRLIRYLYYHVSVTYPYSRYPYRTRTRTRSDPSIQFRSSTRSQFQLPSSNRYRTVRYDIPDSRTEPFQLAVPIPYTYSSYSPCHGFRYSYSTRSHVTIRPVTRSGSRTPFRSRSRSDPRSPFRTVPVHVTRSHVPDPSSVPDTPFSSRTRFHRIPFPDYPTRYRTVPYPITEPDPFRLPSRHRSQLTVLGSVHSYFPDSSSFPSTRSLPLSSIQFTVTDRSFPVHRLPVRTVPVPRLHVPFQFQIRITYTVPSSRYRYHVHVPVFTVNDSRTLPPLTIIQLIPYPIQLYVPLPYQVRIDTRYTRYPVNLYNTRIPYPLTVPDTDPSPFTVSISKFPNPITFPYSLTQFQFPFRSSNQIPVTHSVTFTVPILVSVTVPVHVTFPFTVPIFPYPLPVHVLSPTYPITITIYTFRSRSRSVPVPITPYPVPVPVYSSRSLTTFLIPVHVHVTVTRSRSRSLFSDQIPDNRKSSVYRYTLHDHPPFRSRYEPSSTYAFTDPDPGIRTTYLTPSRYLSVYPFSRSVFPLSRIPINLPDPFIPVSVPVPFPSPFNVIPYHESVPVPFQLSSYPFPLPNDPFPYNHGNPFQFRSPIYPSLFRTRTLNRYRYAEPTRSLITNPTSTESYQRHDPRNPVTRNSSSRSVSRSVTVPVPVFTLPFSTVPGSRYRIQFNVTRSSFLFPVPLSHVPFPFPFTLNYRFTIPITVSVTEPYSRTPVTTFTATVTVRNRSRYPYQRFPNTDTEPIIACYPVQDPVPVPVIHEPYPDPFLTPLRISPLLSRSQIPDTRTVPYPFSIPVRLPVHTILPRSRSVPYPVQITRIPIQFSKTIPYPDPVPRISSTFPFPRSVTRYQLMNPFPTVPVPCQITDYDSRFPIRTRVHVTEPVSNPDP